MSKMTGITNTCYVVKSAAETTSSGYANSIGLRASSNFTKASGARIEEQTFIYYQYFKI